MYIITAENVFPKTARFARFFAAADRPQEEIDENSGDREQNDVEEREQIARDDLARRFLVGVCRDIDMPLFDSFVNLLLRKSDIGCRFYAVDRDFLVFVFLHILAPYWIGRMSLTASHIDPILNHFTLYHFFSEDTIMN